MDILYLILLSSLQTLTKGRFFQYEAEDFVQVLNKNSLQPHRTRRSFYQLKINQTENSNIPKKSEFIFHKDSNNFAFVYWKYTAEGVVFLLTCESANVSNHNKLSSKGCNSKSNLYRSPDNGKTFILQNSSFGKANLHSLYLTPLDKKQKILTDYKNKDIYITKDNGKSFTIINVPFSPTFLCYHPKRIEYIAGYDNTDNGENFLYVSYNGGVKWKLVTKYVRNYFWDTVSNSTDIYIEKSSGRKIESKVISSVLFISSYPYNSMLRVLSENLLPFSVHVGNEYIVVQAVKEKQLFVSYNRGHFEKIIFDKELKKTNLHCAVLSDRNSELLIGVIHPDLTATIYISDVLGKNMQLIQSSVVIETMKKEGMIPKIDFVELEGSFGTYIVNKKNFGTVITHDKGYNWKTIQISSTSCGGSKCDIVLYIKVDQLFSEFTAPLVSKESAPGVIIAQGYLKKMQNLEQTFQPNKVFISVDGGRIWKEHLDSMYGYAILDHGGLIAATPLTYTIDHGLSYTVDYGLTWQEVPITKRYSRIAAIITESAAKTLQLNIFGFLQEQPFINNYKANTWIVWQFNFTDIFDGVCGKEDYIPWKHNKKCVLGQTVTSKRRITERKCINGEYFNNKIAFKSCECVLNDFKCDRYYYRSKIGYCLPLDNKVTIEPKECEHTYLKEKGYIKKHRVRCKGGIEKELKPSIEKCTPHLPPILVEIILTSKIQTAYKEITFGILQKRGFFGTIYQWDFGDNEISGLGSYKEMKSIKHVFKMSGLYKVRLFATNKAGNSSISTRIKVVDNVVVDWEISYIAPIVVDEIQSFVIVRTGNEGNIHEVKPPAETKLLWSFNDKFVPGHETCKTYKFQNAGQNLVEIQIVSPHNYDVIKKNVRVFVSTVELNLTFQSKKEAVVIFERGLFIVKLKEYILSITDLKNEERIIIKVIDSTKKYVKLFICDTEITSETKSVDVANQLITVINKQKVNITEKVRLTRAQLVYANIKKQRSFKTKTISLTIIAPMIVLLIVISTVIYKFRKKLKIYFFKPYDNMRNELVLDMDDEINDDNSNL